MHAEVDFFRLTVHKLSDGKILDEDRIWEMEQERVYETLYLRRIDVANEVNARR